MDENILFVLNANQYLMQNIISLCVVLYELLTKYLVAKNDHVWYNFFKFIFIYLICFCSNLIVRIWFFLHGNLFLCYRLMLFLEFNSQIDCYSLLDKNFLLTTVATTNCLSCRKTFYLYFITSCYLG